MKKIISTAMMLFVMMQINVAFADADSVSSANAVSNVNAGAAASVNNNPVITNTSGVTLAPGAVANNATAGASTSQIGDVSVQTGSTNVGLTFQASTQHIPPPAAFIPPSSGTVPQLFGNPGTTAHEAGLALAMYYEKVCPSPAVRGYEEELAPRVFEDASGNLEILFTPHLNYAMAIKPKPIGKHKWFHFLKYEEPIEVQNVPLKIDESGYFKCLAMVTVVAKDESAGKVSPSAVLAVAKNFPVKNMKGFPKISLLSVTSAIVPTKGVDNSGSGVSVGLGLSSFVPPVLAVAGGSVSRTSGMTYPGTKMGATFIVVEEVDSNDPNAVFIDLSPPKKPVEQAPKEAIAQPLPPIVLIPEFVGPPAPTGVNKEVFVQAVAPAPAVTENKAVVVPVVAVAQTKPKPKKKVVNKKSPPIVVAVPEILKCSIVNSRIEDCTLTTADGTPASNNPTKPLPNKPERIGLAPISLREFLGRS